LLDGGGGKWKGWLRKKVKERVLDLWGCFWKCLWFGKLELSGLHTKDFSVLVNLSPTKEVAISQGLKQGDMLAPFFFFASGRRFDWFNGDGARLELI